MANNNPNTPSPVALQKSERKKLITKQVNIHTRLMFTRHGKTYKRIRRYHPAGCERTCRRRAGDKNKRRGNVCGLPYWPPNHKPTRQQNKEIIADKTLQLLREDMIVLIGGGTTIREFIKKIPAHFTC